MWMGLISNTIITLLLLLKARDLMYQNLIGKKKKALTESKSLEHLLFLLDTGYLIDKTMLYNGFLSSELLGFYSDLVHGTTPSRDICDFYSFGTRKL